jgi:hypothetical protein
MRGAASTSEALSDDESVGTLLRLHAHSCAVSRELLVGYEHGQPPHERLEVAEGTVCTCGAIVPADEDDEVEYEAHAEEA